jgi:hypothetical protein
LKENSKIIIEAKEHVLMPNHIDSLEQLTRNCNHWSKDESENEYVQQFKEMEKCAYDRNEGNKEMPKSEIRTLPLCFSSFKVLKLNVNNVSNQKPSRYEVKFQESSRLANEEYLPLCFSSFEWLKENHEKIEKFDQGLLSKVTLLLLNLMKRFNKISSKTKCFKVVFLPL